MIEKIKKRITRTIKFLSYDIWRIDRSSISKRKFSLYNFLKAFILAFRNIDGSQLNTRAAALTYNTLLSIVPLLAVLFAIARGFGFQNIVESELFNYFSGQEAFLKKALTFVDKSLEYAQGGVFLGVGIVMLLYTVIMLFSGIEDNFNFIWSIKKSRSYYRQFTDYIALFIVIPIFLVCNSAISLILSFSTDLELLNFFMGPIAKLIPFCLTILMFIFIYSYIPNTKVKFSSALFGGIVAGIAFQAFQLIYISGQIWISKYNAIYGSFAALPLFLLWLQVSWFITLFGVELTFAYQNIEKFNFERETNSVSRRYKDFLILLISSLITKRFVTGEPPFTADELSTKYQIPTRLTGDILFMLQEVHIIAETPSDEDLVPAYIPAIDINKITVKYLFDKLDTEGSEDFNIDIEGEFKNEWLTIISLYNDRNDNLLLKDI